MRQPANCSERRKSDLYVVVCLFASILGFSVLAVEPLAADDKASSQQNDSAKSAPQISIRPEVPGEFSLRMRSRREIEKGSGKFEVVEKQVVWKTSETLIIICDMWDNHYCQLAAQRVAAMAPKLNRVITAARNHGAMIIHAPSGTMSHYVDTPYRKRMQQLPTIESPVDLMGWCHLDPKREVAMPVDTSKRACDDPVVGARVRRYSKQHDAIKIIGYDGISDKGQEVYNFIHSAGIKNVVLMGVHTNMCVLGRPFGIRQLVRLGMNVALARDLTDAMYDPREYPFVSHTRGTNLVIEHIEAYWCPSISSADLTKVVPGSADPNPSLARRNKQTVKATQE